MDIARIVANIRQEREQMPLSKSNRRVKIEIRLNTSSGDRGSAVAQCVGRGPVRLPLSQREREIVSLVAQGFTNKEMAARMYVTELTVKKHLRNIFDKLGVSDRLEFAPVDPHDSGPPYGGAAAMLAPSAPKKWTRAVGRKLPA